MNPSKQILSDDLTPLFEKYVQLCDQGRPPDLKEFLEQSPSELREELEASLTAYQFVERIATDFDGMGTSGIEVLPDRQLGDYQIQREIGRGGMGVVFEARQISLDRQVALKILPMASLLSERQIQRFRNEARAAASLRHPNIVGVHGVGSERAVHFYAMELVDGCDLATVIREIHHEATDGGESKEGNNSGDTQPVAELSTQRASNTEDFYRSVAKLGFQAAQALHHAHESGVVHRDIKPANLLIDEQGDVRVTDFGLARIQADEGLSQTGDLIGTLRYMSPEQVRADHVDARTDIYSLGVTLYELCCGQPAFSGEGRQQLIEAISNKEPVKLQAIDHRVPFDLQSIVAKAMSLEPADRYKDARQFAEDLSRFLQHRTINARPATTLSRFSRFARRNPALTALLATTTLLFGILAAGATMVAWAANVRAKTTVEQSKMLAREKGLQEYASDIRSAQAALGRGSFVEAERLMLKWVSNSNEGEDLRGFEWYHLWDRCHLKNVKRTISHALASYNAAFSPDGKRIADAWFNHSVAIWDLDDTNASRPMQTLAIGGEEIYVAETFGDQLVMGNNSGSLCIFDWQSLGSEPKRFDIAESFSPNCNVLSVDVDPTGKWVAVGGNRNSDGLGYVEVWDIESEECLLQRLSLPGVAFVAFSSEGTLNVLAENDPVGREFSVLNDECVSTYELGGTPTRARRSYDGGQLAIGLKRKRGEVHDSWVEVRHLEDPRQSRHMLNLPMGSARSFGFSRSNDRLSVGDRVGNVWTIWLDSGAATQRRLHDSHVTSVTYSPDDSLMMTTSLDKHMHVIDAKWKETPKDSRIARIPTGNRASSRFAVCLDDQNIAVTRKRDGMEIYDVESLRETRSWNFPIPQVAVLSASPEHRLFAIAEVLWHLKDPSKVEDCRLEIRNYDGDLLSRYSIEGGIYTADFSFSPNGRYAALANPNGAVLIDRENQESPVRYIPLKHGSKTTCFSDDSRVLVCAERNGKTHFWDVESLQPTRESFVTDSVLPDCVCWIPNTRLLAVCGFEHKLKIFDVDSGILVSESKKYPYFFTNITASPDGKRIGAGSMEGHYHILRAEDCAELLTVPIEKHYPRARFSPNGESLVIANGVEVLIVRGRRGDIENQSVQQLNDIVCRKRTDFGW